MKLVIEILLSIFLHPIAVVLLLINVFGRNDLGFLSKIVWSMIGIFAWGVGPIVYILAGGGKLW